MHSGRWGNYWGRMQSPASLKEFIAEIQQEQEPLAVAFQQPDKDEAILKHII